VIKPLRGFVDFPGDHKEKQAARLFLYRHALDAPKQGHAVALAGSTPEQELKLLRDYLKWDPKHAWFIDNDRGAAVEYALERVSELWPGVNVSREDIKELAPTLGGIGFANLDFMDSPLQPDTLDCVKNVTEELLPGAILEFTWMRCREASSIRISSRMMEDLGKGYSGNEKRWKSHLKAFDYISNGTLKLIGRWEYFSWSPMAVSVFRKE